MNTYTISKKGLAFIKNEEGCRLKAYADQVGVCTIGYGHTGKDVSPEQVITKEQADVLLLKDVKKCELAIQTLVKKALNQDQVDALCSFIFNVGVGGFQKSTLLKVINTNPNDPEVGTQLKRWTKGTVRGKTVELTVLKARRQRESNLYFSVY